MLEIPMTLLDSVGIANDPCSNFVANHQSDSDDFTTIGKSLHYYLLELHFDQYISHVCSARLGRKLFNSQI